MYAIETRGLAKIYRGRIGRPAAPSLDALDLTVGSNEIFGFLGQNGAGKTTTIKVLCGLIRQTRGTAAVCGIDVRRREARQSLGYLPENPYFYEYLTPRETINFYGQIGGLGAKERERQWGSISELLDLREIAGQRVRGFSKGMRQRLGFAVALVGDPAVLILDEPMSGLDPLGRRRIRELMLHLRTQGKTVFFSSHVLGDVEQICDRVAILSKGRLVVQGRVDELLSRRVTHVEVIASGLPETVDSEIAATAVSSRNSEEGRHFVLPDLARANDAVRRVHAAGASLVEFSPVRESLEDYFLRLQERKP